MKPAVFFVFLLLNCTAFSQHSSFVHKLDYLVDISDPGKGFAAITLSYEGSGGDSVAFHLPSNWGDEYKLTYFRLTGDAHSCRFSADSVTLTCFVGKQGKLQLHYQVLNAVRDSIAEGEDVYHLQLKPNYFSAFSNGLLLSVDDSIQTQTRAVVQFRLPAKWKKVYSNFGEGTAIKTGIVANSEVQNGIFLAGDYRVYQFRTATKQELTFCIRGNWSFADQALVDEASATLDQQRRFWDDFTTKKFFISINALISPDERSTSYTGTGLSNAFAMSASCNKNVTPTGLRYLLNHELMHHWIGGIIENAKDEELSYWFSEGFTDYFARLNMLSSTQISQQEYNGLIDSVFRAHYSSEYIAYPNDSIKVHFWDNRGIEKLPYNRGSLFALYLDNLIRLRSDGKRNLHDFMDDMLSQLKLGNHYAHRKFETKWLSGMLKATVPEIDSLLERHIFCGEPISIDQFNEVLSPKLKLTEINVFDMGFESEKTPEEKGSVVTSVKPGSGAEEAGILAGDRILGYDLMMNPNMEGRLLVKRNGEEKWVNFYPYLTVRVPQFEKE